MNTYADLAGATAIEAAPPASRTSALLGSAIDTVVYDGVFAAILASSAATAGTNPTLDVKLTSSDTSGGTYTDVPGGAFAQVTTSAVAQMIPIDTGKCKRYVKIVGTLGGTSTPTFVYGVALLGQKKYR